ncbi:MAG: septum site-determining protein MinD [Cyanobacteria bacterium P01_H01_bin.74]
MMPKQSAKSSEGRVIVVTSGKGGVGKTTTTANIGSGLARLGLKVALVDTDIGLRNLDLLMGLENRIVYNIVDVVEGRCKLTQALVKDKRMPNLALLPAAQTRDKSALSEDQIKGVINSLKATYDFILVDSPAGIEQGFINATTGATEAIVVCTPEMSSVRDADRIIGLLEAKEDLKTCKLIINRVRPGMIKNNDMMDVDDVLEILSIKLLGVIPEDQDIIISTNKGEPIVSSDNSLAGTAYRNIARRVNGEDVPFLNLDVPTNWLDKIKGLFTKSA